MTEPKKISTAVLKQMVSQLASVCIDPRDTSGMYWEERIFTELDKRETEIIALKTKIKKLKEKIEKLEDECENWKYKNLY